MRVTLYEANGKGSAEGELFGCDFDSDSPPRVGEFVSFMSTGDMRHFRVLAVRHGVSVGQHTTVELVVQKVEFTAFRESAREG